MAKHEGKQFSKNDAALLEMAEWLDQQIKALPEGPKDSALPNSVICMLAWGHKFISKMLSVTFKSLMADGNLPSLCAAKKVVLYIQTDNAGKGMIELAPIVEEMKALGIHFKLLFCPTPYWRRMTINCSIGWSDWERALDLLTQGTSTRISIIPIPTLSTIKSSSEVLRLTAKTEIILGPGYSVDENVFRPTLANYESDDSISVPCADLAALTLNALHMSCYPFVVNNRPVPYAFPRSHSLIWEGQDAAYINCPHMNAYWLSAKTLKKLPADRYYISLDSEMDLMCADQDFYIPQAEDKLFMQQLVEQSRYQLNDTWSLPP